VFHGGGLNGFGRSRFLPIEAPKEKVKFDLVENGLTLENDHTRSKGVHLSDLVRGVALKLRVLKAQWADAEIKPNVVSAGLAWEDYISKRVQRDNKYKGFIYHPGEICHDDVYMTCDGVSESPDPRFTWRVHEFKFTWKSGRNTPEDDAMWMYMAQLKAYCLGWETPYGSLHVFSINGDYSRDGGGPDPLYQVWDIEFTVEELESNWKMLLNYKKYMEKNS
jgi:hypothetical protein